MTLSQYRDGGASIIVAPSLYDYLRSLLRRPLDPVTSLLTQCVIYPVAGQSCAAGAVCNARKRFSSIDSAAEIACATMLMELRLIAAPCLRPSQRRAAVPQTLPSHLGHFYFGHAVTVER